MIKHKKPISKASILFSIILILVVLLMIGSGCNNTSSIVFWGPLAKIYNSVDEIFTDSDAVVVGVFGNQERVIKTNYYHELIFEVIETVKGDPQPRIWVAQHVTLGSDGKVAGPIQDEALFEPGKQYVLFLVREVNGKDYYWVTGAYQGVFPVIDNKIEGVPLQQFLQDLKHTNETIFSVTIAGLEKGDQATLILTNGEKLGAVDELFFKKTLVGQEAETITVEIPDNLESGTYQLLINAPEKYYRYPQGYLFTFQSEILNLMGRPIAFALIPPSERSFEILRDESPTLEVPEFTPHFSSNYRTEYIIPLSLDTSTKKQGERSLHVRGEITGLKNQSDVVKISFTTPFGQEEFLGVAGNTSWEYELDYFEPYYVIKIEAEGYAPEPASYKVQVGNDHKAYFVNDNGIREEALHIDFVFSPDKP